MMTTVKQQRQKKRSFIAAIILALLAAGLFIPKAEAAEPFPYEEITVNQLLKGYSNGTYTTEEVVQAYLDRIETYESSYNAFTVLNPDAIEQAREIDRRRAAGEPLGPLAGIPVVVKESVDMTGFPATFGWEALGPNGSLQLIPAKDAPVVARLKKADAIIIGRTNIPAFSASGTDAGTSWAGHTYNAYDRALAPGGSSSGTAMAISGNFAVLGIAEETGGSIQNPAAAQGVVGIKPTFGLVPNTGVVPLGGSTRDVVGPHARTVRDAAIMLDVLAGYTPEDPKTVASIGNTPRKSYTEKLNVQALKGKRIGLYGPGWRNQELTPDTQALYDEAVKVLEAQGAIVVADPFAGSDFAELIANAPSSGLESFIYDLGQYVKNLGNETDTLKELFAQTGLPWEEGGPIRWISSSMDLDQALDNPDAAPDLDAFSETRSAILREFNRVMDTYDLDALAFPQMFKETPTLGSGEQIGATTVSEINMAGVPLVTVPAGYYPSGAPFALAFVGKMWSEADLLAYAYDYEQATTHRKAPELVVKP
mgnify:CR=1 FL=1